MRSWRGCAGRWEFETAGSVRRGLRLKQVVEFHPRVSYCAWKAKFGGMNMSDAQRLKALEAENGKLKRLAYSKRLGRPIDPCFNSLSGGTWPALTSQRKD